MSWIFSKAMMKHCENLHYSQAQAGEYSEANCSDGKQYAQLNVMPTQAKFWRNDKMMEFYDLSRFGLTLKLLTEDHGKELLTLYLEGFLVNHIHCQENEKECKTIDGYGLKLKEFKKNAQLELFGSKMYQESSQMGQLNKFFQTWPKWVSMRNRDVFQQQTAGPTMYEKGHGYLPTPTAHNSKEGAYPAEYTRNTPTLATHAGGKINPEWTEFLMGWPLGWTDLKPLGMDKFLEWKQQHSKYLVEE